MNSETANAKITEAMIAALEKGIVPWHQPWRSGLPLSMWSGNPYRGINVIILGLSAVIKGYSSPWWGSFDRIAEASGCERVERDPDDPKKGHYWVSPDGQSRGIRRGEKSATVYFWERRTKPDPDFPDDRDKDIHFTSTYSRPVFNMDQADFPDGIPAKYAMREVGALPEPEKVFTEYLNREHIMLNTGSAAWYEMDPDEITLPARSMFESPEAYVSAALHEGSHSTGHPSRLNRPGVARFDHFGSGQYAKEELVAEMGAAMLCAMLEVEGVFDNSAAYIAGWLKRLKSDPAMLRAAARDAQKAADLIMGTDEEEES